MKGQAHFISLEGIEGMGKSTAMKFIQNTLDQANIDYVVTREPGGTPIAEDIRRVLLNHHPEQMCADTEALLMFATRAQNITNVIKPALARGQWVICDRFTDASFAYQSGGRGIPIKRLQQLADWVLAGFTPDITLLLDAPVEVGFERIKKRKEKDRIEKEALAFFKRARQTYLDCAAAEPGRFRIIRADQTIESVQREIKAALAALLA